VSLSAATSRDGDHALRTCRQVFVGETTGLELTGDDAATEVSLPFPVTFYGTWYSTAWVANNGFVSFAGCRPRASTFRSRMSPTRTRRCTRSGMTWWWTNRLRSTWPWGRGRPALRLGGVAQHGSSPTRPSDEDGTVINRYDTGLVDGDSATIGLENADGTDALQYSYGVPVGTEG
jgi:hypothetical protein